MLGKIESKRRRGWQRIRWLDSITNSIDMNLSNSGRQWRTEEPGVLQSTGSQRVGSSLATEQQEQRPMNKLKNHLSHTVHFLFQSAVAETMNGPNADFSPSSEPCKALARPLCLSTFLVSLDEFGWVSLALVDNLEFYSAVTKKGTQLFICKILRKCPVVIR